jgi:hypothetical protein
MRSKEWPRICWATGGWYSCLDGRDASRIKEKLDAPKDLQSDQLACSSSSQSPSSTIYCHSVEIDAEENKSAIR